MCSPTASACSIAQVTGEHPLIACTSVRSLPCVDARRPDANAQVHRQRASGHRPAVGLGQTDQTAQVAAAGGVGLERLQDDATFLQLPSRCA
jgi:hypothetical protein